MSIEQSFQSGTPERKRFMADLFSLFSADIVRCWAADSHSPYSAIDAPVLRRKDASRGSTLDFAFIYRRDLYVALMRCDPLLHGTLHDTAQVDAENTSKAFAEFLDAAQQPQQYIAIVDGSEQPVAGSILIWLRVENRRTLHSALKSRSGFHATLALETMIADLMSWHNRDFQLLLDQRFAWCHDLFKALRARR